MPTSSGSRDYGRFDKLAEEFAERYRRGERPSLEEYVDLLPEMADEIREMFPALVEVERVEGDARDDALQPPPPAVPRLRQIGDYRIVREIGHGGMGVVYEAEQVSLGRRVALKVLPRHVVGDRKVLQRFRREAKAAARLHHTNIVPVFEVGQEGEVAFYAMQFIQGQGLDQVVDELGRLRAQNRNGGVGNPGPTAVAGASGSQGPALGRVADSLLNGRLATEGAMPHPGDPPAATGPDTTARLDPAASSPAAPVGAGPDGFVLVAAPAQPGPAVMPGGTAVSMAGSSGRRQPFFRSVAQIGRQAAQGLAYAHSRGVVHRDIKPSNLLLDTAGVVWITDFGLAKAEEDGLTATGDILGTIRYMAPERFRGEGDARADIYALGLTVYELLTLKPAYDSSDRLKLIGRIKTEEPARPRSLDARIPRDLETIVLKASDKDPARRYATAEEMAEDLRRFLDDEPIQARRTSAAERYWRWARRNPINAVLGGVLTAVLVLATTGSLIVAGRMTHLAQNERNAATAERSAREEASRQAKAESLARTEAEAARTAALAETYRAVLSEARALRAGHQLGWRDEALADLARLAASPSLRRDLLELRTEAVAALGTPDVRLVARIEPFGGFRSFAFGPDSQTLVTAGCERGLDFWDVQELKHVAAIEGLAVIESTWARKRVLYLPHGQGLAVATRDQGVVFTDPSGMRTSRPPITRGTHPPSQLAVDSEGRRIAVTWADRAGITVHDLASGAILGEFSDSPFALSPDGQWLAHPGQQGEVHLDRIGSKERARSLGRHDRSIAFAFSSDGSTLGSTSRDQTAILWDVAGRRQPVVLRGHREAINDLAFSPDGGWVATASNDHTARIWDVLTGQSLATLPGPWFMVGVGWSPDGACLAVSDENDDRRVFLYRVTGRQIHERLTGHGNGVQCVAANPRLDRLATGADDHLVFDWDLTTARPSRRWSGNHPQYVMAVAYSPDGSLLATGAGEGTVLLRDAETGVIKARLTGHNHGIPALAFDPSCRWLASGDVSGHIIVWDLATKQPVQQLQVGPSWVWSIAFLDGGRKLVSEVSNGPVVLFDLLSGKPEAQITAPGGIRRFVADPARKRLIVAFNNGDLCSLSTPDLTPGHRLEHAHPSAIESLALSPDGRLLATGGADRRVVLRDPVTFEPLLAFPEWTGMVKDLAFTPSGRRLAYVGADSDIALWDLTVLHEGLQATGLAWDQPTPAVVPASGLATEGEHVRPAVPVIRRPGTTDPTAFERARLLVRSGAGAFESGRRAEAIRDLQQARDRLRTLHQAAPGDGLVASQLGISLGFLSNALRNEHRPAEALEAIQESRQILEAIRQPTSLDLYDLACAYANLSTLVESGTTPPISAERGALADRAMEALRRSLAAGMTDFALMDRDRDLDPLRGRSDFRALILDRGFPSNPFAPDR